MICFMQHMKRNIIILTIISICQSIDPTIICASDLARNGDEFLVGGNIPGDQSNQNLAMNKLGGFITWNDHHADNDGLGISLLRLDENASSIFEPITVNETTSGDQLDAQIVLLSDLDLTAVVVWESNGDIYARFISAEGVFATGELLVNETTDNTQNRPVVASLGNGNVVFAWSSLDQDGSHYGVFARVFSAKGKPLTGEIGLSQETDHNQKSLSISSSGDGGFYAVWVSEQLAGISDSVRRNGRIDFFSGGRQFDVVLKGRHFDAAGNASSDESALSSSDSISSNPHVINSDDGSLGLFYSSKPKGKITDNNWDVYYQAIDARSGSPKGEPTLVNSIAYGDQFAPRACATEGGFFVTWTSLGHDGDSSGIYGKSVKNGVPVSKDLLINTTTSGRQFLGNVASVDDENLVVTWSGFSSTSKSLEVFGQRFKPLAGRAIPSHVYGFGAGFDSVNVVWPDAHDESVSGYRITYGAGNSFIDTEATSLTISDLKPGQVYNISLSNIYADGTVSADSVSASTQTWGIDANEDGLPDSWQASHFGIETSAWKGADGDSDGDGATNLEELLAGTDPSNPADSLTIAMYDVNDQSWLSWTTIEGGIYQLQQTSSLNEWQNIGAPRFGADSHDAVQIQNNTDLSIYRIVRLK